jgi:mono/diheme cytochrome c family protein
MDPSKVRVHIPALIYFNQDKAVGLKFTFFIGELMKTKLIYLAFALIAVTSIVLIMSSPGNTQQPGTKPSADTVKRGKYLVTIGGCNDCHTPKIMTAMGPAGDTTRLLMGHPAGQSLPPVPNELIGPDKWGAVTNSDLTAWLGPWGVSFSANLTPDKTTGMGAWTESAFIKAMRTGRHMGAGRPILPPMPWPSYGQMTDEDLKAIFAYLKSIKPIQNEVPLPIPPAGAAQK